MTWTGLETFITSSADFVLEVITNYVANAGASDGSPTITYTVSVQNTITVGSNGPAGSSNFAPTGAADKVEFEIIINNPCWQAVYDAVVFDPLPNVTPFEVTDGESGSVNFNRPSNDVETLRTIPLLCGDTSYEVFADTSDTALQSAFAFVESTNTVDLFKITVDTTVDLTLIGNEASVTKSLYIKTTLDDYPNVVKYNQIDV